MESHLKSCYSVPHGCPCGFHSDPKHECRCSPREIERYRRRVSGPLMDRIDIQVEVPAVAYGDLSGDGRSEGEPSSAIRQRVEDARRVQRERFRDADGVFCNARMHLKHIKEVCVMEPAATSLLGAAMSELGLSARGYHRILKVARTIADLAGSVVIEPVHVSEAVQYRGLDRRGPA